MQSSLGGNWIEEVERYLLNLVINTNEAHLVQRSIYKVSSEKGGAFQDAQRKGVCSQDWEID